MKRIFTVSALVGCLCGATLGAHEIGTTRVSVEFGGDRSYAIEIVTDATSLVEKLDGSVGANAGSGPSVAMLQSLIERNDEAFRRRASVRFDEGADSANGAMSARPAITYAVHPAVDATGGPVAVIRITGRAPAGAHHFTWTYGWTFATYSLTTKDARSAVNTTWLEGGDTSPAISIDALTSKPPALSTAARYLSLGFTHILPYGVDHVLFVLGIFLLSTRVRDVLWQVSAFTVAHSITLAVSLYGLVAVSPRAVEPLIAVSIVYVAIENIYASRLRSWRIVLVFAFGLLHGLGFAGVLKDAGLSRADLPLALASFNVGVEAAQLAVIGVAFVLVGWQYRERAWYRTRIVVPASMAIGCTAIYWTIERLTL